MPKELIHYGTTFATAFLSILQVPHVRPEQSMAVDTSKIVVELETLEMLLHCVVEYNVSDTTESDNCLTAPMIYYEKAGGGPERDRQFLGQTKDGLTITNVRFALNANWNFLEGLSWTMVNLRS